MFESLPCHIKSTGEFLLNQPDYNFSSTNKSSTKNRDSNIELGCINDFRSRNECSTKNWDGNHLRSVGMHFQNSFRSTDEGYTS